MKPGTDKLLARAERALDAAALGLEGGAPEAAAGRAYYAVLYAAKAVLNERGVRLRGHARIAAAVADQAPLLHAYLTAAIARRRSGEGEVTYAEAQDAVARARACVAAHRPPAPP